MLIRDLSVRSFHQSCAINKRKAQETTSSVRLLAVTILTVLSTQKILTPSVTDSLSLLRFLTFFLAQNKIFQAKPLIVCFPAQEMKGVIVSSQEFPEGLLANVLLYYNLLYYNRTSNPPNGRKPLSDSYHAASWVFIGILLLLIYSIERCFQPYFF